LKEGGGHVGHLLPEKTGRKIKIKRERGGLKAEGKKKQENMERKYRDAWLCQAQAKA